MNTSSVNTSERGVSCDCIGVVDGASGGVHGTTALFRSVVSDNVGEDGTSSVDLISYLAVNALSCSGDRAEAASSSCFTMSSIELQVKASRNVIGHRAHVSGMISSAAGVRGVRREYRALWPLKQQTKFSSEVILSGTGLYVAQCWWFAWFETTLQSR